jgi:hypothetical protein
VDEQTIELGVLGSELCGLSRQLLTQSADLLVRRRLLLIRRGNAGC